MAKAKKQTKDDYPQTLLYSQKRLWVKPGEERHATIGVALPALADKTPNIYFVDIQQRGYIVEGRAFGAIDLDVDRFELIAPFSARIEECNFDVMDDPLVLLADAWREGWLLKLSKVKPGGYSRLLERDRFFHFLEFEREARRLGLKPVMNASYRVERDAPWPDDARVTFGGVTVLTGRLQRLGRNATFTPQWLLGERWRVETRFQQPSMAMVSAAFAGPEDIVLKWHYEVVDADASVNGDACYVLKVVEVEGVPPQSHFLLSIAKDDFTLRLVEEVSAFDPARRTRLPNDWGRATYVELRQPRELILDLPMFPAENKDEDRLVNVEGEPEMRQSTRFPDATTMRVACEAEVRGDRITSEQTWERGLPWWREARRRVGEKTLISGKFLGAVGPDPEPSEGESDPGEE